MYNVWLLSIFAGLFIEMFFRLIRFNDEAGKRGPIAKYRPYDNYVTVNEFVAGGNKRWWKYILFRSVPPFLVFILLTAIYQKYFPTISVLYPLVLAAIVFLLPRDIYQLFRSNVSVSEKIVHLVNMFFVAVVIAVVFLLERITTVAVLAPSLSGIVDNVWSSLFVATLIIFYIDATNRADVNEQEIEKENLRSNYIITIHRKLSEKFGDEILKYCKTKKCSVALLYAILIYEDMNRPVFIRIIENLLVRIFPCELTVGIAQVKSRIPLTDEESIEIATHILKNTDKLDIYESSSKEILSAIKSYNPDKSYAESVIQILNTLRVYDLVISE